MSAAFDRPLVREATLSAAVAAALAGVLLWFGPPGVDLAAHAYQRTFLLHNGFAVWNNFWYAGRYSFVTYSFIYYPLAALLGIKLLGVLSMAVAAAGFALLVGHEWGAKARFSSRTFMVLWPGVVLTAAFPFILGFALGCSRSCAAARAAAALRHARLPDAAREPARIAPAPARPRRLGPREPPRRATVFVLASAIAFELVLRRLFPGQGRFPFTLADLVPGAVFGILGIAVTARVPAARRLFGLFAVFLIAIVVAFVIPSDLGSNVERLKFAAVPLALLAAALAPKRIVPVVALVAFACFWNITALARHARAASSDPASQRGLLATGDHVPAGAPQSVLPGRGGRHDRALAGRLSARRRHPDRARLVSPERLPAERAALRPQPRGPRHTHLVARPRRALRRHHRRSAGLQRARRGSARPLRALRARAGLPQPARDASSSWSGRARSSRARATRTCSGCGRRGWSSPSRSRAGTT